jgi:PAS domain S-box-containing protein
VRGLGPSAETDRFELLAAVGRSADGTLSLGETVERLLDLVVPEFADVATLDASPQRGELRRLGARVDGPLRTELERALMRRRRVQDASLGIAKVVVSGESHLLSPVTDEHLRALATTEVDHARLASLGLRSVVFVPLRARGQTIGVLACALGASGRDYTQEDLRFAEVLAGRFALALDNAGLSEVLRGLELQLEATLANLAEAVIVRDAGGRIVFANDATARLLGVTSPEDVTSATPGSLMALYDVFDEHGQRLELSDLPSSAAQRGELPSPLLVRNVIRATGDERWLMHKATPVLDREGELSLIVSVVENVTEVKRAELAQRLLAEAGKELSSSFDYEQTLQRLAQLAVPELADWCGVSMRGANDILRQVAVAHSDPDKVALARELGERYPARLSDHTGAGVVIRSGKAQLVPEITEELLAAADLTDDQRRLLRDLQMRSLVIVPLAVAGHPPIGALALVMADSGRVFDENKLALAEELGRRAAIAVENARLYTERSRIATTLQQSLLPPRLPEVPGFRLASLYRPAGDENEVGGDFYDAFEVPGGWMVVVGDVAGRGAEAAALTSLSRYTLRAVAKLLGDPIAAVEQLNAALRDRPQLSLVSVCCALLRTANGEAEAQIVLAGHPPAYHVHHGTPRQVGVFAPFLGAYAEGDWTTMNVALQPGDQLVFYTDGVIDTVGETERFGEERLASTLHGVVDAPDAVGRIEEALIRFERGPQADDTAVLAVQRLHRAPDAAH